MQTPIDVYESRATGCYFVFVVASSPFLGVLGGIGWLAGEAVVGVVGSLASVLFAYGSHRALAMRAHPFGKVEFFADRARIFPGGSASIDMPYEQVVRVSRREGPDGVLIYFRDGRIEEVPPCTFADYRGLKAALVGRLVKVGIQFVGT